MTGYTNGTKTNPYRTDDWSDAFDVAVERDQPTYCVVTANGEVRAGTAYPSRTWREDTTTNASRIAASQARRGGDRG